VEYQLKLRMLLWPVDAGDRVEAMCTRIRKALSNLHPLSDRDLQKAAHMHREGSGGPEAYVRAMRSTKSAKLIKCIGQNRAGRDGYCLETCTEHPERPTIQELERRGAHQ